MNSHYSNHSIRAREILLRFLTFDKTHKQEQVKLKLREYLFALFCINFNRYYYIFTRYIFLLTFCINHDYLLKLKMNVSYCKNEKYEINCQKSLFFQ